MDVCSVQERSKAFTARTTTAISPAVCGSGSSAVRPLMPDGPSQVTGSLWPDPGVEAHAEIERATAERAGKAGLDSRGCTPEPPGGPGS